MVSPECPLANPCQSNISRVINDIITYLEASRCPCLSDMAVICADFVIVSTEKTMFSCLAETEMAATIPIPTVSKYRAG